MKYVVIAIAVFIVLYTFITLRYRKPGPGYQPYHDTKERAVVARLRSAGFTRLSAQVSRPADTATLAFSIAGAPAKISSASGGLPADLQQTLIDAPRLPLAFTSVRAADELNSTQPYSVEFTCTLPNNKLLLGETFVYLRGDDLAIVPNFETISGELLARTAEVSATLSVGAGTIPAGQYHVTLVGAHESKHWTLQVH